MTLWNVESSEPASLDHDTRVFHDHINIQNWKTLLVKATQSIPGEKKKKKIPCLSKGKGYIHKRPASHDSHAAF